MRGAENGGRLFCAKKRSQTADQQNLGLGRPNRRRSLSAGDVEEMCKRQAEGILDMEKLTEQDPLSDGIERELRKLVDNSATRKNVRTFSFFLLHELTTAIEVLYPRT
jgi:hypothetical protein